MFVRSNASSRASRVGKKQRGQPDVGPAGDASHGSICTVLAHDVTRDFK